MKYALIHCTEVNNNESIIFDNLNKEDSYILKLRDIESDSLQIKSDAGFEIILGIMSFYYTCSPVSFSKTEKIIIRDPKGNLKSGVIRLFKVNIK